MSLISDPPLEATFANNLSKYIDKLQEISRLLNGSRAAWPLRAKRDNRILATKSVRTFLATCALTSLLRRNVREFTNASFVALITVPTHWRLNDVQEAAKLIFKDDKQVRYCIHPTRKHRRGWEIEASEYLSSSRLFVFLHEGSETHEDFALAATVSDRLLLGDRRHLEAASWLRGCGSIPPELTTVIAQQPAERLDAIFRLGQPAERAALRLLEERRERPKESEAKQLDVTKGFGKASLWAQELKRDLQEWREGKLAWSDVDKGCLLYGPPGTGKTRFAAALAAECDMHLEATSISKWQSSKDGHLGDLLRAMYRSFASAKENAPALLFLDEFDSIGDRAKFDSRHADYSTQVVNGLLECLDGIDSREGVIVVGACNNPQRIDPALVRAGRLETHVFFPMPDATARAEILGFHLPTLAEHPSLQEIAARLPGMSGADLERLSREARRTARRERRDVDIADIEGRIEPFPVLNEADQLQVAIHEAGHALVAYALQVGDVRSVEIYDNLKSFATEVDAHGLTAITRPPRSFETKLQMMNVIGMHLAGAAAEEIIFHDRSTMASGTNRSDFAKATEVAVEMVTKYGFGSSPYFLVGSIDINNPAEMWKDEALRTEVDQILKAQYGRAKEILDGMRDTLISFARELATRKRLQGGQLEKLWPTVHGLDGSAARRC